MINEALQFLSPDPSEEAWDNRFKEATLDCERCHGTGWIEDESMFRNEGWFHCGKCRGDGEIYTMLCERCGKDENNCQCNVEDFR